MRFGSGLERVNNSYSTGNKGRWTSIDGGKLNQQKIIHHHQMQQRLKLDANPQKNPLMKKLSKTIKHRDTIFSHGVLVLQVTGSYKEILGKYHYVSSLFRLFCICGGYYSEQNHLVVMPCLQESHSNIKPKSETAAGSEQK